MRLTKKFYVQELGSGRDDLLLTTGSLDVNLVKGFTQIIRDFSTEQGFVTCG